MPVAGAEPHSAPAAVPSAGVASAATTSTAVRSAAAAASAAGPSAADGAADDDASFARTVQVRADLISSIYSHIPRSSLGVMAGALTVAWGMWGQVSHARLILWLAAIAAETTGIRFDAHEISQRQPAPLCKSLLDLQPRSL